MSSNNCAQRIKGHFAYSNTVSVFYLFGVSGLLVLYFDVTLSVVSCFDYLCFPTCAGVHYETVQHDVLILLISERGRVNVQACCAGPPVTEILQMDRPWSTQTSQRPSDIVPGTY